MKSIRSDASFRSPVTTRPASRSRDHVSQTREKADRFLLVRGDDERILSVCLDYEAEYVQVTDLLHERKNGAWTLRASSYRKLRLDVDFTRECLLQAGLSIERSDTTAGVVTVVARRPTART